MSNVPCGTSAVSKPQLTAVESIYQSNFRAVAATLRVIADEVERGDFPDPRICVIALESSQGVALFSCGQDAELNASAVLFQRASQILAKRAYPKEDME